MVEYCVYWLENGEPMHEVFSNLAAAEMYSCAIRGKEMFCEMNDRFLVTARRFLKSDEGQVEDFYYQFREQKKGVAMVHSITGHNGFTLRDLVSYDVKHNEANGEKNLDGTEYNYRWNWMEEC